MENQEMRNKFCQSVQQAAVEILGYQEIEDMFGVDFYSDAPARNDFDSRSLISEMSNEFSLKYHRNTARGLFLRIGDAAFPKLRRHIAALNALGSIENRLQPLDHRFETSLQVLIEILSDLMGVSLSVEKSEDECFQVFVVNGQQSLSSDLLLYFLAGLLRAFGTWLDSRRDYRVQVNSDPAGKSPASVSLCILPAA